MRRRSVLSAAFLLAASVLGAAPLAAQSATVVIIVRHAEKEAAPANDPPLTATGTARANALAAALGSAKVDVVMHTPTTRTRETARPVAERFGLTPEVLPLGPMAQHAQGVADAVRRHTGKTIVVVGHSNTIMAYVAALGGPKRGDLCDHQYDGIYTLVIEGPSVRLVEGRYGPANPTPATACEQSMTRP
jgi:broad specificity phosphatase PhoE